MRAAATPACARCSSSTEARAAGGSPTTKGRVIDLALARGDKPNFPYERGKSRPFRGTKAGISNAAKAIVDAVLERRKKPRA